MLRKITSLFICVFIGFTLGLSAQVKIDSLKQLLNSQSNDTVKVNRYSQLYESLKFEKPNEALAYLKQSLRLSSDLNFEKGMLNGLLAMGDYLETVSEQDSALHIYGKAQNIAERLGFREGILESFIGQGSVLSSLQRLDDADSIAYLGIEMAKKTPIDSLRLTQYYTILSNTAYFRSQYEKSIEFDQQGLVYNTVNLSKRARSLLNIGTTHDILSNYKKANEYYLKALATAKTAEDDRMMALVHLELGTLKTNLKEFEEARRYYGLALNHFEKVNDKTMSAHVQHNLAKIHVELGEFNLAISKFETALKIINSVNSPSSKGHFLYQLGLAYYKKKDYQKAEEQLLKAKSQFDVLENTTMQTWVMSRLSDVYAASADYQKAFVYLQKVKARDDSIFTATSAKEIAEVEEKFQNEQKQKEIDLLNAENQIASLRIEKQKNLRNYLIIAALLLLVLIGVVYNRYQLKAQANAKLEELDSLKTNFFTNISHEFRTPLTLILSPVQKLLNQHTNKETKEALRVVHRNATVMTELTNQLLDLSKLEAGELKLKVSQNNLKTFLKVVCASFESLAIAQKIEFVQNIEKTPEEAYFDEDKVQKILNNLLSNAFKFTSKEGKVTIKATRDKEQVAISIQDSGPGISPDDQKLIFRRFHQTNTNTSNVPGTGVGLTLSKEMAQLHKGDIEVVSNTGDGATFTVFFPISKSAYREDQIIERSKESPFDTSLSSFTSTVEVKEMNATDKMVLLVEDNPDLRTHISGLLKDDFTVKQAVNGKEGVEAALELIPDIIISDLMMPKMDGVALCKMLKTDEKTSHIPIILLTAKADRNTKLESLKTGADDFLVKPFDNEELLVRIENIITQRQKLQQKFAQTLTLSPSKIEIQSKEEAFIKKALEVVDYNLSNSEFSVESFQKEMCMSRMQLHRKLKALTNFSASEFIRDIRLQRASDLLSNNGLNVSEVAYSCGFNSISYFTQCFKQKFGVSPSKHSSKT